MIDALRAYWEEVEKETVRAGIVARRFRPDASIDCFVGIENPGAVRLVVMEASRSSFGSLASLPDCMGFSARRELSPSGPAKGRLVVRLLDSRAQDIFATLVADVLSVSTLASTEKEALTATVGRLDRWRRFLESHGNEALTRAEQVGLYGELAFLEQFILPRLGSARSLSVWTGPAARDQDFQLPRASFEIKTTASNPDHHFHVANVRQLDDSIGPQLVVVHVVLEERKQGRSLVGLVAALRRALGEHVGVFDEHLLSAGYIDAHGPSYESTAYAEKRFDFFHVTGDFPRILERDLRPGVGNVSYDVSLGACAPYVMTGDAVAALLGDG